MQALQTLREVARQPQRVAREAKAGGKKVLGYRCVYVPEEIPDAAGVTPFPVFGTPEAIALADSYLQPNMCEFIRNIFDLALKGKLDFLDGLVLCNTCDAVRKLFDHWKTYVQTPFCYLIANPQKQSTDTGYRYQYEELRRFKEAVEGFAGTTITDESLRQSIRTHNETRSLLRQVYELRKQDPPLLSGEEALSIVMGSIALPKDRSNALLRQLLSELLGRQPPVKPGPRIMVTGSIIDNPTLLNMVEELGGSVVIDDLCSTTRTFWHPVEEDGDPLGALAHHTIENPVCACMHPAEARFDYMLSLAREYNAQGIIYFNLMYCDPFLYEGTLFKKKFEEQGIPTTVLQAEHTSSSMGQLRTRVQAFLEML